MLTTLYVARHAHRMNANHFGGGNVIPRDPPLTARGEEQTGELSSFFASLPAEEQPQWIVCSPYTRCLRTAMPVAECLHIPVGVEPGLAEWFAPAFPQDTGVHPSPRTGEHVVDEFPTISLAWTPLLYPDPHGETIPALHERMREVMRRIEKRCAAWGIERVLLVSHAASIIALGRMIQTIASYEDVREMPIRAGTASVSKYTRAGNVWHQEYNGATSFLLHGEERAWDFSFVPDNNTEPGMGPDWHDPFTPSDDSLVFRAKL
ncbi:hypothetical protein ACI68E_001736 [Malassezia pachydermatis]